MRLRDITAAIALLVLFGHALPACSAVTEKIDSRLQAAIASSPANDFLSVLVVLRDNAAISMKTALLARRQPTLEGRYRAAYDELKRATGLGQSALLDDLRQGVRVGSIRTFRPFWITNAIGVQARPEEIERLASRDDVERIVADLRVEMIEPVAILAAAGANQGPTQNLLAVGARELWNRGLTGTGRLICSIDTGVEGIHPAVANKWRGRYTTDTAACWYDPFGTKFPEDKSGHGTHVMGIMVGSDGADTIGLAPDARWICAAVIDRGKPLGGTITDILAAFEWVADPDGNPATMDDVPDVVCNSWGLPKGFAEQCSETFWDAIDDVEALGIVCVFAAGNEGPLSMTMRNPADRASSPTNSFAVGAADAATPGYPVASFSSRGPSSCDLVTKKPEVVAPGIDIYSSYKGGIYKLISGTSMSAPHVAAAVALFRQYNPDLTPEQIKSAILLSAIDIGDPGEDNESGMGFINLAAALALLPSQTIPEPQIEDVAFDDGRNNLLDPGEAGNLVVTLRGETADAPNVVGYLSTTRPGVVLTKDTAYFGAIAVGETGDNAADPFVMSVGPAFQIGDSISFTLTLVGDGIPGYQQREFTVVFGVPCYGKWATLDLGAVKMTASNFGAFGLHDSSYVPLGGEGFTVPGAGGNFLYEAGLVVKAGAGPVSDEVRIEGNGTYDGDFRPLARGTIATVSPGTIGDLESVSSFNDAGASVPLGIHVRQCAAGFSGPPGSGCILLEWTITNAGGKALSDLAVGLFTDWDIPGDFHGDRIVVDTVEDLFYQHRPGGAAVVGVAAVGGRMSAARFYDNGAHKRGFSEFEKYGAISGGISAPGSTITRDWCGFAAAGPYNLDIGDSVVVTFALCSGPTIADFYAAVADARNRYFLATAVEDGGQGVPRKHELVVYPNYPNPFNPQTRIDFEMPADGWVEAVVYDILGRKVANLTTGFFSTGVHTLFWNGRDEAGREMASGMYFCRVSTVSEIKARKMVLVR